MRYTKLFKVESWITQFFGYTHFASINPGYSKDETGRRYHEGLDLVPVNRKDWELFTPCDGRVTWAGWGDTYGFNIIIFNEFMGLSFRYCHLDSMDVKANDLVRTGEKIGTAGNSGKSTAAHLHMNVVPMREPNSKEFAGNGFNGRVDPLGVIRALKVHV